jgi:hypothetical protein
MKSIHIDTWEDLRNAYPEAPDSLCFPIGNSTILLFLEAPLPNINITFRPSVESTHKNHLREVPRASTWESLLTTSKPPTKERFNKEIWEELICLLSLHKTYLKYLYLI